MINMINDAKKYSDNNLIIFSINIDQKQDKSGKWKKNINFNNQD